MDFLYIVYFFSKKQYIEIIRRKTFFLKLIYHTPISIIIPSFYFLKYFGNDSTDIGLIIFKLLLWNIIYFSGIETLNILQKEINNGTIAYIIASPSNFILWIIVSSMIPTLLFVISMIFYFLTALLLSNSGYDVSFYILQILLCIPVSVSLNILISAVTLYFKKTFNIINALFDVIYIFVGVYYTIDQVQEAISIEGISKLIPLSYIFNEFIFGRFDHFNIYVLEIMVLMVASLLIFRYIEKGVKNNGSIYKY